MYNVALLNLGNRPIISIKNIVFSSS